MGSTGSDEVTAGGTGGPPGTSGDPPIPDVIAPASPDGRHVPLSDVSSCSNVCGQKVRLLNPFVGVGEQ